jgi:hypothetical protein
MLVLVTSRFDERRRHQRVLRSVEGTLVLADDDRVPPAVRVGQRSDGLAGWRTVRASVTDSTYTRRGRTVSMR